MESDCGLDGSLYAQHRFLGCLRAAREYSPDFCRQEHRLAHLRIRDAVHMVSGNQSDVHLSACPVAEHLLGMAVQAEVWASNRNEDGHRLHPGRVTVSGDDVYR